MDAVMDYAVFLIRFAVIFAFAMFIYHSAYIDWRVRRSFNKSSNNPVIFLGRFISFFFEKIYIRFHSKKGFRHIGTSVLHWSVSDATICREVLEMVRSHFRMGDILSVRREIKEGFLQCVVLCDKKQENLECRIWVRKKAVSEPAFTFGKKVPPSYIRA